MSWRPASKFHSGGEIEWHEIYAAAAQFTGEGPIDELWEEAFRTDPHTPRDQLFLPAFGGSIRVRARFDPSDWQIAEVEYEKSKEAPMTKAYQELRDAGHTYDDMAEANLREMIRWKLGPIVDPSARIDTVRGYAEWIQAAASEDLPNIDAGSPYSRTMAFAMRDTQAKRVVERYPALGVRGAEFAASDALRHMPALAYPALLRAGSAAIPDRQPRPSDGYDINCLTRGLSRCDIVTADGGMTQLCRGRKRIPDGCNLLSYRELDRLPDAIVAASSSQG